MNKLIDKLIDASLKIKAESGGSRVVSSSRVSESSSIDSLADLLGRFHALLSYVSFKGVVVTCMLLLIIVLSAVGVVYSSHLSRQLFAEQAILLERNDQLQLEWAQLLLEQSAWSSPNRIEDVSRSELGMKVPETEEIQLIY